MQKRLSNRAESARSASASASRPPFGLARDQGRRIEVSFLLKNGGAFTIIEEMEQALTAELLESYSDQLAKDIAAGTTRAFADGWGATGQRAWVDLGQVAAFSTRPAR